ncbi:hypothetical protein [Streptomyces sp. NPDC058694]|uniref:hypothetical protein n=1 Tax=Streptomyces sp. NPDC058694 TaxID=3346603 RepID=UPI00365C2E25
MNDRHSDDALLITGPFRVTMADRGVPARPDEILVFSQSDRSAAELTRPPKLFGSLKYYYRYGVDTGDHVTEWAEALPSGTGGFPFQTELEARWRVTGATEVVRRDIRTVRDGDSTVHIAMRDLLWPWAAQYGIERLDAFATFIRTTVCSRPHELPEGLTVVALTVRIHLDDHASGHLRNLKQQQFDTELAEAKHSTDMTVHQLGEQLLREREKALLAAAQGDGGLLIRLIAQDESRLHEIMQEMAQRHDMAMDKKSQMLKDLIEARLVQPAEAQAVWQEMSRSDSLFGREPGALAEPTVVSPAYLVPGVVVPPDDVPPQPRYRQETAAPPSGSPSTDSPPSGSPRSPDREPESPAGSANVTGSTPVGRRRPRSDDGSGA